VKNGLIRKTDIISVSELSNMPWVLIGIGGYARILIEKCKELGLRMPELLVGDQIHPPIENVDIISEQDYQFKEDIRYVLGSDIYQIAILQRLNAKIPQQVIVYDCSADLWSETNSKMFHRLSVNSPSSDYILIFCISPNEQVTQWLNNLVQAYETKNIEVRIKHPLQAISDNELLESRLSYVWNGSVPVFSAIKQRLQALKIRFKYLECGFFPQNLYFYIDDVGINAERSLAYDKLNWVTLEMRQNALVVRNKFFAGLNEKQKNFIFVPLQLPHDSNIQSNSRFKNGMQEFIDFIENCYPTEKVVFKKHPKDPVNYSTKNAEFSQLDSRVLILQSRLVHGINSTVLFEAALAGKPIIAEGKCLLNHFFADQATVIAAIIASQVSIEGVFDVLDSGDVNCSSSPSLLIKGAYA
jgi:hypothetical protein